MEFLNKAWLDLIAVILGLEAVNIGLTGKVFSQGRSGRKVINFVHSRWAHLSCSVSGLAILMWVAVDLRHKFPA